MARNPKTIITLSFFLAGVAIQFYPVAERDVPSRTTEIEAPSEVDRILRRSCYDCHSSETRWPWYSDIAPASWLIAYDVHEGRRHLNFSRWPQTPPPGMDCLFKRRMAERAESSEMPPIQYRLLHPSATLTAEEKALLRLWAAEACAQ